MKWLTGIIFYMVTVLSSQAADSWPLNVCKELASEEWLQDTSFSDQPESRALARVSLLRLMHDHCGVDTRAKMKADEAAFSDADKRQRRKTCTTMQLGGGLSTTTCDP
jgi:hypothetical protein